MSLQGIRSQTAVMDGRVVRCRPRPIPGGGGVC
jgi:hypothetical protein